MEQKQLALQPRLALLAELVPPGCRLTDIGTDHGYLPVYLLQQDTSAALSPRISEQSRWSTPAAQRRSMA